MSPDGKYYIWPLRINGSAIESLFSLLKFSSGGNLSGLSYGPALGKVINRKEMTLVNKYSEKGYRDLSVNVDGIENTIGVASQVLSNSLCIFPFPTSIAQSTLGGRQGSNACTLIATFVGSQCMQSKLAISVLWNQLPVVWVTFVNSICDGNAVYDELYSNTAVFLDVDDVVNAIGNELNVQSANQLFGFSNANNYSDLVDHINHCISSRSEDHYGVIIGCDKSVGLYFKCSGMSAVIDSHVHTSSNAGAFVIMGDSPRTVIDHYVHILARDNQVLNVGTLTWVKYKQ